MNAWRHKLLAMALAASASIGAMGVSSETLAQDPPRAPVNLNIEAQPLGDALAELAKQSGLQVMLFAEVSKGLTAPRVVGSYSAEAALKLLLTRTDLSYEYINDRTVAIRGPKSKAKTGVDAAASGESGAKGNGYLKLAVQGETATVYQAEEKSADKRKSAAQEEEEKNVVVVTGTNIRGGGPVGQQSDVYTREDLTREGIGNLKELGDLIPQNFGGGNADPAVNNLAQATAATIASTSGTYSSSFNLRGLGVGSTLTLLNGRRVAPSGVSGAFGITAIPVNLLDRIEIVPDGGSAIYGSDAVGGVINVITRTDFTGLEATARYGAASGHTQTSADLLAGKSWGSGNAFVYLDYAEEDKLVTGERDFVSLDFLSPNTTLVPKNDHQGVFGSFTQTLSHRLQAGVDVLWSEENMRFDLEPGLLDGFPGGIELQSHALHGSARADYALNDDWNLNARVDHSTNDNVSHSDSELVGAPTQEYHNSSTTLELAVTGSALNLPAGEVQMAFGALARRQKYATSSTDSEAVDASRDVRGAYGEFVVPVARDVKLNLAGRWDDYSTGGSRVTPKYGISWQATEGLSLRASYSQAYRVPLIPQQLDRQSLNFLNARWNGRLAGDQDPRMPAGQSYFAYLFRSGNPDLVPETADIFTAGFDFKPEALPGFRTSVTYFDIQYSDIILSIFPFSRINNPAFAEFVYPYPSLAFMQELVAGAETVNNFLGFPIDLDSVQVAMDSGVHNMAAMQTSGFDINTRYGMALGAGKLNFSVKASYVLKYILQATNLATPTNNVDRVGDPLRLTMRGSAAYSRGGWTVSTGIGFKDSYIDDTFAFVLPAPVDSIITFDLGLRYDASAASTVPAWAEGLDLSLHVRNITDEKPPFVQDFFGFNYDTAHGDPIGRIFSLEVSKKWGR